MFTVLVRSKRKVKILQCNVPGKAGRDRIQNEGKLHYKKPIRARVQQEQNYMEKAERFNTNNKKVESWWWGNLREQLHAVAARLRKSYYQVLEVQRVEAAPPRCSCTLPLQKWLRKGNTGCCLKKVRQVGRGSISRVNSRIDQSRSLLRPQREDNVPQDFGCTLSEAESQVPRVS